MYVFFSDGWARVDDCHNLNVALFVGPVEMASLEIAVPQHSLYTGIVVLQKSSLNIDICDARLKIDKLNSKYRGIIFSIYLCILHFFSLEMAGKIVFSLHSLLKKKHFIVFFYY